jgi:DNA-binding beta-propeller fold protein YncE
VLPGAVWLLVQTMRRRRFGRRALALGGATALGLAVAGCRPPSSAAESPLRSRLFERAVVIGARGVGVGEFNKPRSVAVDAEDNLYVADMTGRIQKFGPDGRFLLQWHLPEIELGKPKGMGRDRAGNILVVEPHYQRVNVFSPRGELLARWGCKGTNAGCFLLPRAVAVNSRGDIFVSEYMGAERVQVFRPKPPPADGVELIRVMGRAGVGPGEFNRAEGLCVDAGDRLYVADSCNHRIQIFSAEGAWLRAYGRAGSAPGELSYPYDIAVDAAGFQFVCEFGNSRIQVFDADCRPAEIIGGPGAAPGQFANPWGLALDSRGNLYVADSQNHRVQKLVRRAGLVERGAGRAESGAGVRPAAKHAGGARPARSAS